MAPRAHWKGHLRLSLVSCAVALYSATSLRERVSFHLLNRRTGHRLKQQYIDSETGDLVEKDERIRGYEFAKGEYAPIDDEELDALRIESAHTIDIDRFVERSQIDEIYHDQAYYLAPDDKVSEEAFVVIREAMRARAVAGLGRIVLNGRERVLLLEPRDKGLLGVTLHYSYEVRADTPFFEEIPDFKPPRDMLDLASHIIDTKKGRFDPAIFEDRYEDAVVDLVRAKKAGRPIPARAAPAGGNVINLMDALKRSLETGAKPAAKKKALAAGKTSAAPRNAAKRTVRKTASARGRKAS
jgi:DNA end-binding protein Ku